MKRPHNAAGFTFCTSRTIKSIFSSPSHSTAKTIFTRLSQYRGLSISLALGMLLTALTLSASPWSRSTSVAAFSENISTFDSNCSAAKDTWTLGQSACAVVTGATDKRRIAWVAPDGSIAQLSNTFTGTGSDTYAIPTGTDPFAQVGTWIVKTIDNSGAGYAAAKFLVIPDNTDPNVDLLISKFGPDKAIAGSAISYRIEVVNRGPNTAQSVVITEPVPNGVGRDVDGNPVAVPGVTFASEAQPSGQNAICGNPNGGETGTSTCTIASLAPNERATFTFVYNVGSGMPVGTRIINTATVTSSTNELSTKDNTATYETVVSQGTAPPACTIGCPADRTINNVPGESNPCVKTVTYPTPISTGCADPQGITPPVVCSPASGSAFPIGTSSVVCSAGETTCDFTITVIETRTGSTLAITQPADVIESESSAGSGSARVNYPAPLTTGNCVVVVCNPPSGSPFNVGTTPVTCTGTDSSNSSVTTSFTVTVNANTCSITCPADKTVSESAPGSGSATVTYSMPTTSGCPTVTITCNPPSGNSFSVGTVQVSCAAKNGSNIEVASCSFTVTVTGSSSCTITCPANVSATESPANSSSATVTYATPTSTGTCATAPVSCSPPSGSSFPIGTTTVTCTRSDPADHVSTCSFTVTVTGGTPCVITCPSTFAIGAGGGCGNTVTYLNPTTKGSCGGDPSELPFPPIPTCNPPSGSFFPVGATTVICTTDVGTQCSFIITITGTDSDAPVISSCAAPTSASADSSCQAVVPNVTSQVEASDYCTPADLLTITQNPAPGTVVGTGTTTITVTVRDASNNFSTCMTTFTVTEPIPPAITCPTNVVVFLPLNSTATSMAVTYPAATATDNCPGVTVASTPASGSIFPVGTTTVNATATDAANNTSTCSFTVTVLYNFTGFFSPIGNPPVLNSVNAGRAIPVKFSLSGNKGLDIFAPGFPASGTIACDANAPPAEVTETVTAGNSSLSFGGDQYNYVWKTESSWAGTCRQLVIKLNDGSVHVANFKFR